MFGSLRKKLEETAAQINPFDGGKTAATVRANRNQAPPAQTIRSQPNRNSLVGRNDNQPGFQITNNSFTRGLSRGFDQANMFDNNRTWQQRTPTSTQSIGQEAKRIVNTPNTPKKYSDGGVGKAVNTAIAGTNRAAAGIGQDFGGLIDYVTPGKGTNRVTSYFKDRGAMWDEKAKEAGVDGLGYKASQVPLNVASYMVPGAVAKGVGSIPRVASTGAKVANIASKTPGVSSVLSAGAKLSTKLDDIAKTGNIAQRTGARLASSYMSKPAIADVAFDTMQSAGSRTSKGQDNSFGTLAVDTGLSLATQGGVNLAGQALKPVTTRLVQTAKNLPSPAQVTTRLAGASRKIDQALFTPRLNRLDLDTRDALIAYSDRLVGADPDIYGKVESDLISKVRAIGDANGVDLTNGTVVQQLDRIEALLNGYKSTSGALNSKPVPVDPLESLKQEARKYKSAEEFVKAQGEPLYHGTTEKIQGDFKYPLYTTPKKDYAQVFADSTAASSISKSGKKLSDAPMVHEFAVNPKARVLDITNPAHRKLLEEQYFGKYSMSYDPVVGKNGHIDWTEGENLAEWIEETKQPFDAIRLDEGGGGIDPSSGLPVIDKGVSYLALNKNALKSKSQLTDLYNQSKPSIKDKIKGSLKSLHEDTGGGYDGGRSAAERANRALNGEDPLESLKQEARKYKSAEEAAYTKNIRQPIEAELKAAQAEMDKYGTGYINDVNLAAKQAKARARLDAAKEADWQNSESKILARQEAIKKDFETLVSKQKDFAVGQAFRQKSEPWYKAREEIKSNYISKFKSADDFVADFNTNDGVIPKDLKIAALSDRQYGSKDEMVKQLTDLYNQALKESQPKAKPQSVQNLEKALDSVGDVPSNKKTARELLAEPTQSTRDYNKKLNDFAKEVKATQAPKSTPTAKTPFEQSLEQAGLKPKVKNSVADPLEALKQEARKYKSAEEFVKANYVAHGTPNKIEGNIRPSSGWYGKATYLTDDITGASGRGGGQNIYFVEKPKGKLLDIKAHGSKDNTSFTPKQYQDAIDNGYDGLRIKHDNGKTWYAMFKEQPAKTKQQLTDLYNQATQSQPPKSTPVQKVEPKADHWTTPLPDDGKPLAPKVEVPTGFSKSLEDAGFSTPQSRVGRNKVQADSAHNQAHTPNQSQFASKEQAQTPSENLDAYRKNTPSQELPSTQKSEIKSKQGDQSSDVSSDNIIDLESIDVNDPFGNKSLTKRVKNEFNRMFIDEDAEMISLLRKVEKETGSKDMVEKWLQDTDMVRGSNSIANSKVRSNENLKGAIHGLSKKEVKQLDEYASARSELYNLENGLSASKSKEKLQSIISKHEAKYGKRFESLNKYYNDLAKDLHEAGIISKQQLETWSKNKDYVRVQRDMEDLLEPSVGKSRSRSFGSTSTSKKRTGSKRDILSPTETAFKRTQEIQLEIQRNKAASNIIDVLEKHGLSERIPQSQAHGKNVIKRFKDGKVEYFATNKDIKRVIENVRPFELGVIAKVVSFPTRVFKAGTTGLSAPFAVTNYARDQVGSAIYSKSVMATHNPKNIVSGIYQGVKDFGGVGNSDIWEKFVKHAGDQTSFDMTRGTLGSKSIMNEVRRGSLKQRGITLVDPRYLVRNVEDLISITEKSTRYQNFKGIYEKAIKEGLGEDVAIQKATQAALQNSVNFGRAGSVAKAANLILPYFNAGIQGSRNLGRSFIDRPVATAAKSVGFVGIPMVALTLHNYSDPETREIYSNIDETEKQDNFIIVLPGAKQRDDGTYEGILKIPKPQGYRELLDPLRSYAESFASGEDPKDVASMLKDMLPAISGPIQTEDTGKLISSLTPQALKPALQAHLNKDLYWGNDVVPDYMIAGTDDPTERARKNTSGMARFIANRLNVSPIAVEKFIIDSTGSLGRYGINAIDSELARRDIIPDEQIGGRSISSDFKRRTTEARGIENKNMTDGQRYFRDREEVTKSLKPQQKTAWESYNQSNKNFKGEVVFDKSSFAQKQAKASAYVQFPELFETDKKLDKKARDRGEPGNPLYDLNYKQAIKVVLKKALPPGSKDSELDALYNQPWYADFKAKESQYYDKIFAGKEKEDSGYPQKSPELQKKMDYYYTLPKGTGQRSDFLKSNPDVIQHWDAVEAWTNGERAKIGLDPTTKDDSFGFGSGGGRGGRKGRSKAGYDYTKALFDANVGSVSMTKDLQSILEKYMKANAKISKKA